MNTNTFNSFFQQAVNVLEQLYALPSPLLVGLSCIVIGYMLKRFQRFPNDAIPLVVILWGAFFTLLLSGNCPPELSVGQWRVKNAIVGLIIGFAAWGLHYFIIAKLEDKFPWLDKLLNGEKTGNGGVASPPDAKPNP